MWEWLKRLFGGRPEPVRPPAQPPYQPPPDIVLHGPYGPMRKDGPPMLVLAEPLRRILGMDISHWQPNVNWARVVSNGFQFCFAKASDGTGKPVAHYETHRKNAEKHGIPFGSYHFARFGGMSAKEEAAHILKITGGVRSGELPIALDLEWQGDWKLMNDAAAAESLEILHRIEEATGVTPIIYTSYPFFRGFSRPERFFRFHPWLAAYSVPGPKVPVPWSNWAFWQWHNKHPLARSITGDPDLDANYFQGRPEDLQSLRKK